MTRGLLGVVVVDAIKRRYFAALKRVTVDKALSGPQTVALLADIDRLLGAYEDLSARVRQIDLALDRRAHTPDPPR